VPHASPLNIGAALAFRIAGMQRSPADRAAGEASCYRGDG
jgi:hypothetical protein